MNKLDAEKIIQLLEAPTEDRRPVGRMLRKKAHVKELVAALEKSKTPLVTSIICTF